MSQIYSNIKEWAAERKLSIRFLEDRANLSAGSVCKWNNVSPSVESLKKVADLLDVPLEALLKETQ